MLVLAGVVAVAALGLRLGQVRRAASEQARMALVAVPVDDLGGGFVVRPTRRGYRLRHGEGGATALRDGDRFTVAGTEVTFHGPDRGRPGDDQVWSVVLSTPLRVLAARETDRGPRGGYRRIDIGGDPAGAASGTRDRIFVDPEAVADALDGPAREAFERTRGVAHLLPAEGEVFRLEQRSFRVVAEIEGLERVRGGEREALAVGAATELWSGDRVVGPGLDLRFDVEERLRSAPVRDRAGAVVAQRAIAEPALVVRAPAPAPRDARPRAYLSGADRDGEPFVLALAPDRPTLLYGARDRLRPLDGHVIPRTWTDEARIEAFDAAVAARAITLRRGFLHVAGPDDPAAAHLAALDPTVVRALRDEVERYNRGQVPATVQVSGTLGDDALDRPAGWTMRIDGEPRTLAGLSPGERGLQLPPPGDLDPAALPAGARREWTLHRAVVAAEPGVARVEVASGLPVAVTLDGELLGHVRGEPLAVERPLEAGAHELILTVRYQGRPDDHGTAAGVRAELDGARLVDAHAGRTRFAGWTERADGGRLWGPAEADASGALWLAGGAPLGRDDEAYLQLRFDAPRAGPSILRLETAGELADAHLNGAALPADALPFLPGESAALAVPLRRGSNLLALRVRQPTALPDEPRGGVRLRAVDGTLVGLAPDAGHRSMADPDREDGGPALVTRRPAGEGVRLVVARGIPGLPEGTEWWVGPAAGVPAALLLAPAEAPVGGEVLALEEGLTVRCDSAGDAPFTVVNRSPHDAALFRQLDPMRRPYQPFGGFLVRAGWRQPLRHDRDAVRGSSAQATYRVGAPTAVAAAVTLARADGLHCLRVDGDSRLLVPPDLDAADHLQLGLRDGAPVLEAAAPGTTVFRDGVVRHEVGGAGDLPLGLASGDALSLPGTGLLLVVDDELDVVTAGAPLEASLGPVAGAARRLTAAHRARRDGDRVELTVEPLLQLAAEDELEAQLERAERTLDDAGQTLAPGPEGLQGAVVALDVADGAVLAAASVGGDDRAAGAWRLAFTHPGSTFKIVTILTALGSADPDVVAMLDGDLPEGLRAARPGTLQGAELARLTPSGGRWSGDDDEPIAVRSPLRNFRGQPLPVGADLRRATVLSSNTYFGYLVLMLHRPLREGWSGTAIADPAVRDELMPLLATAEALGFGEVVDLVPEGLSADASRTPPVVDRDGRPVAPGDALHGWTGRLPDGPLDDVAMAAAGVGQGEVYATPLQVARVAATVARGGVPADPYAVSAVGARTRRAPRPRDPVVTPAIAAETRELLSAVVQEGTAAVAFEDNPYRDRCWGKTGSAERPGPDGGHVTDSWFVVVIEPDEADLGSEDRRHHPVAVACVMPGAGLGGTHAAEVVDRWVRVLARTRGWTADE